MFLSPCLPPGFHLPLRRGRPCHATMRRVWAPRPPWGAEGERRPRNGRLCVFVCLCGARPCGSFKSLLERHGSERGQRRVETKCVCAVWRRILHPGDGTASADGGSCVARGPDSRLDMLLLAQRSSFLLFPCSFPGKHNHTQTHNRQNVWTLQDLSVYSPYTQQCALSYRWLYRHQYIHR